MEISREMLAVLSLASRTQKVKVHRLLSVLVLEAVSLSVGSHCPQQEKCLMCTDLRLMRSLVTSIFLYACESWTLTAELQRRIQAIEMMYYRKILHILYKDHVTNGESLCQDPAGN